MPGFISKSDELTVPFRELTERKDYGGGIYQETDPSKIESAILIKFRNGKFFIPDNKEKFVDHDGVGFNFQNNIVLEWMISGKPPKSSQGKIMPHKNWLTMWYPDPSDPDGYWKKEGYLEQLTGKPDQRELEAKMDADAAAGMNALENQG